jgi:hypothetical protein
MQLTTHIHMDSMEPITEDVITHDFELYYSRALSYKFRETAFYLSSTSDSTSDDCIFIFVLTAIVS